MRVQTKLQTKGAIYFVTRLLNYIGRSVVIINKEAVGRTILIT